MSSIVLTSLTTSRSSKAEELHRIACRKVVSNGAQRRSGGIIQPLKTIALSSRASILRPSPTLSITAKAKSLRAEGKDVLSFAAGEPDFNTPEPICRAAIEAIEEGFTKYTPSSGIPDLKDAICEKLWRENSIKAEPGSIVCTVGAKHALYNAMQVLIDPGDEVILFAPYWMTYADQVKLAGGVPVVVRASRENGFVPRREDLLQAITSKTKAIVVNSPSNPTGALFNRQTLKDIAMTALRDDLYILSDEIYDRLVYGETHASMAALSPEVAEHTITFGGVSKSYAMTGWRLGFACAPAPIAKAMSCLQDQMTSNPTSFVQRGAAAAFRLPADQVEPMRAEFEARRDLIVEGLRSIPGVKIDPPKGAFYAFADFSAYLGGQLKDDVALAEYLLDDAMTAVIPGSVFEGPGFLRMSYAASRANIETGVKRIGESLAKLT